VGEKKENHDKYHIQGYHRVKLVKHVSKLHVVFIFIT